MALEEQALEALRLAAEDKGLSKSEKLRSLDYLISEAYALMDGIEEEEEN